MNMGSFRNALLSSTLLLVFLSFIPISIAQADTTPPTIEYTTTTYTSEYASINITARVSDDVGVFTVLCLDLNDTIGGIIPGTNHTMTLIEGTSQNGTYLYQIPRGSNQALFVFYACDTSGNWASTGVNGYLLRIIKTKLITLDEISLEEPVGGVWVPVDKLGLLAPYIGLASTIAVAAVATAIYVRRRNEKE